MPTSTRDLLAELDNVKQDLSTLQKSTSDLGPMQQQLNDLLSQVQQSTASVDEVKQRIKALEEHVSSPVGQVGATEQPDKDTLEQMRVILDRYYFNDPALKELAEKKAQQSE